MTTSLGNVSNTVDGHTTSITAVSNSVPDSYASGMWPVYNTTTSVVIAPGQIMAAGTLYTLSSNYTVQCSAYIDANENWLKFWLDESESTAS